MASPFVPDARIGNYQLKGMLGAGGMGEVYRAHDARLNRDVALKVLRQDARLDPDRRARFEREARAAAALSHPNIVAIHDIGEQDGWLYIVSELVAGETLRTLMRSGPLPVRKILDLAIQIAGGMAAAHAAGITHRDLKPENIMVTADGRAKILDFGVARIAAEEAAPGTVDETRTVATEPGRVVGTISYMSPEQARGSRTVDYRSDQFSFGLILYELAGGRHAFGNTSGLDTLAAILRDEPAPLPADIPAPLRWIVERCLAKDAADRYDSTGDLVRELKQLRQHLTEADVSTSAGLVEANAAPDLRPAARARVTSARSGGLLLLVAVLAIATAFLGWAVWRLRQPTRANGQTIRPLATGRLLTKLSWSPDGKAIAYGASEGADLYQIWIRYLDAPVPVRITKEPGGAKLLGWSPDSSNVYYTTGEDWRSLRSISITGGQPEDVRVLPRYWSTPALRPDGNAIAILQQAGDESTVSVASPIGAEFEGYRAMPFRLGSGHYVTYLEWSPDGSKLLLSILRPGAKHEFWLLPWPAAAPKQVLQKMDNLVGYAGDVSWMPDGRHVVLEAGPPDSFHLWMADTQSGDASPVTTGAGSEHQPSVRPDGSGIAFHDTYVDFTPIIVSLEDGSVRDAPGQTPFDWAATWSMHSNVLAWNTMRNGAAEVWVRDANGSERVVASDALFANARDSFLFLPAPSPDGTRVAFSRMAAGEAPKYWVVSLAGAKPVRLTNNGPEAFEGSGAWSPDGTQFAVGTPEALMIVGAGGQSKPTTFIPGLRASSTEWSPDGRWITAVGMELGRWVLVSPQARQIVKLADVAARSLGFSKDSRRVYGIRSQASDARKNRSQFSGVANPVLFYIDISQPEVVHDVRELDPVLTPDFPANPGVRFSVAPDGKTAIVGTYRRRTTAKLLENFQPPSLFRQLGLSGR